MMIVKGLVFLLAALLTPIVAARPVRREYLNFIARRVASFKRPRLVVTGDSLAVGGDSWGWRLFRNPFASINLANGGNTSMQIVGQVRAAANYRPHWIMMVAGINDAYVGVENANSLADSIADAARIASSAGSKLIICLPHVPPNASYANRLVTMRRLAAERIDPSMVLIDLRDVLAGGGLCPDGVHLSSEGYGLWTSAIKRSMAFEVSAPPVVGSG